MLFVSFLFAFGTQIEGILWWNMGSTIIIFDGGGGAHFMPRSSVFLRFPCMHLTVVVEMNVTLCMASSLLVF